MRKRLERDEACPSCGFLLWEPIAESPHSKLGLYNDNRFPGRSILTLRGHFSSLEQLPMDTLMGFMRDVQVSISAIQAATGAARVNVAILGNRDPHVHAHLVPRFPQREEFPDCSPWNDMRPKIPMKKSEVDELRNSIHGYLTKFDTRRLKDLMLGESPVLFDL
ncbi:HIT family protein [Prescottella equi]